MPPFTFALDLPPGIVSDDTTFGAEGRWADGNNVRFRLGRPEAVCASVFRQTLPASSATCRTIFTFQRSGSAMVAYGQSDNINSYVYVGTGTGVPSLRATLAGGTQFGWVFATWGDTLLFVRTATPGNPAAALSVYEQSGTGSATEITQAPNNITHMLVTPERQLLALGCNEEASGTFNPRCIRGCDLEDYTAWTTSATNNAFEHILDDPGAIVAGTVIGSYVAVWTTTSLWIGQYIGDPAQAYRFDRVATNCGLMGAIAFTVVDQTAFWVGSDFRFRRWSPGNLPEIIPCPIFRDFEKNLGSSSFYGGKVIVGANTRRQEVWIAYRDARDTSANENSRYFACHYLEGFWFRGNISITAWDGSALAASATGENLGAVLRANASQQVYVHDVEDHGVEAGYIQSADQYLDDSRRRIMIRGFIPDFEEQVASVDLTIFVRDRPMSNATTKGPHTITTATTRKNFRASGKIVAAKFSWPATSGTSGIRFGKPIFDVVPLGER